MTEARRSRLDYDSLAGPYAAHRRADDAVLAALRTGANVLPSTRVLEVGCGTGDYVAALSAATGCTGLGVEPSAEMLAIARGRHRDISFRRGTAERLPCAAAAVEFVFSVDVVHHLRELNGASTEALRVLRAGGRVCVVTEDEESIRSRLHSRYFPESIAVELERYPTLGQIREALRGAGFIDLGEQRTVSEYVVVDARAYAEKAFSSLHLIGDEAHGAGLARLERDLRRGPVKAVSRALLVWATRPRE